MTGRPGQRRPALISTSLPSPSPPPPLTRPRRYLAHVLPSELGTQQPPWFLCTPEYWRGVCVGTRDDCCLKAVEANRRRLAMVQKTGQYAVDAGADEWSKDGLEMSASMGHRQKQAPAAVAAGSGGPAVVADQPGSDGSLARPYPSQRLDRGPGPRVPVEPVSDLLRQQEDPDRMRCVQVRRDPFAPPQCGLRAHIQAR